MCLRQVICLNMFAMIKLSVFEAGNNILFAKLQTFAPDLNVNEARRRGQGGNLIHGWFPKTMTMTMAKAKAYDKDDERKKDKDRSKPRSANVTVEHMGNWSLGANGDCGECLVGGVIQICI